MIRDILLGLIMGMANVLPGISGGTIVFVSGRYPSIISATADLVRFRISKKDLLMLVNIGVGAIVSIVLLSKFIEFLYQNYPARTTSFFAGLIAGGLFYMWKEIRLNTRALIFMVIGGLSMLELFFIPQGNMSGMMWIFSGGFIAGGTMILPGISGSSMLLILGVYDDAIRAVADLNLKVIAVLGMGALLGIAVVSILMKKLVERWKNETISFLYGLTTMGLIYILLSTTSSLLFLFIGFASMMILSKVI